MYFPKKMIYFLIGFLPNSVIVLLVFQYAIIARILLSMFKNTNKSILYAENSVSSTVKARIFVSNFTKRQNLSSLSAINVTLCDLTAQVSSFYGFPVLCCISYMLASFVGSMYFLLVLLIERKPIFTSIEYVHIFLFAASYTVCILSLTRSITEITNEV